MNNNWPNTALHFLLTKSNNLVNIQSQRTYKQITARLWGKGIILRGEAEGATISASQQVQVKTDQFIISKIDARNGAMGLIPESLEDAIVSNDFPVFDIDRTKLVPAFLDWLSKTRDFRDLCRKASEGTTNRIRLKEDRFLKIEIPLPPLTEQKRIVAKIESVAGKLKEADYLKRQARIEAGLLSYSVLRQIFADLNACERVDLREISHYQRGRFGHRPRNEPLFYDGPYPFIQINDIPKDSKFILKHSQSLNEKGLKISILFPAGTIVLSIAATIGAVGVLGFDSCMPDSLVGIIADTNKVISHYLYYFFRFQQNYLSSIAPKSAQKNINIRILNDLRIPLPTLFEQQRIVARLDSLQAKLDSLKSLQSQTAAELNALMPSILDKAFKGEL